MNDRSEHPGHHRGLSSIVAELPDRLPHQGVTLGSLIKVLGARAPALVLLVFAIPAIIPTPGIPAGMVFGTAISLIAVQIIWGARRLALPGRIARVGVPRTMIEAAANRGAPWLARVERWLRPRGEVFQGRAAWRLLGLVVLLMAVLIALPIPFGNTLPGIAILMIALGLSERDSLAIGGGLVMAVLATAFSVAILAGGWYVIAGWFGGAV